MPRAPASGIPGVRLSELTQPDGSVRWMVRLKDELGVMQAKVKPTRKEAIAWAINQGKEFAKGHTAGGLLFSELARLKHSQLQSRGKSAKHLARVELVGKAVERAGFDNVKAATFRAGFERWLGSLHEDWYHGLRESAKGQHTSKAPSTAASKDTILAVAKSIINVALECSPPLLVASPLKGMKRFQSSVQRNQYVRPVFTAPELRRLVSDDMAEHPLYIPVCLMAYTGARPVEAFHLRWEWIDWESRTIDLKYYPTIDKPAFALKTGERTFPLEPELYAILKPLAKPHGWIVDDARVRSNGCFRNECERTKEVANVYTKPFYRYAKEAGIEIGDRVCYSLRHNWIAMHMAMGCQDTQMMLWAGHRNISTTLKYAGTRERFRTQVETWGKQMRLRSAPPGLAKAN